MSEEARIARTESVFREVNEAIAKTAERFEADEAEFVCECADPSCAHRLEADLADYEEVREHATHFLLAPGHEVPRVERVIRGNGEYAVVEKVERTVASIARQMNPRAA